MKTTNIKLVSEYDGDTGEFIKEYCLYKKDKTKLTEWRTNNLCPTKFKGVSRFSKLYHKELPKFSSKAHYGSFFILLHHLAPEFNYIGHLTKDKGWIPYNRKQIESVLEVCSKTLQRFLNECFKLRIIARVHVDSNEEYYMINPIYGFNGQNLSLLTYFVFKSDPKFMKVMTKEDLEHINEIQYSNQKLQFDKILVK